MEMWYEEGKEEGRKEEVLQLGYGVTFY
jgi:hypothetical protein